MSKPSILLFVSLQNEKVSILPGLVVIWSIPMDMNVFCATWWDAFLHHVSPDVLQSDDFCLVADRLAWIQRKETALRFWKKWFNSVIFRVTSLFKVGRAEV